MKTDICTLFSIPAVSERAAYRCHARLLHPEDLREQLFGRPEKFHAHEADGVEVKKAAFLNADSDVGVFPRPVRMDQRQTELAPAGVHDVH